MLLPSAPRLAASLADTVHTTLASGAPAESSCPASAAQPTVHSPATAHLAALPASSVTPANPTAT